MRRVAVRIHTAHMGEDQLASHFVGGMNGINNVPLPLLRLGIWRDDIAGTMNPIEIHIVSLELGFDVPDLGILQLSAEPLCGTDFAGGPSASTHRFKERAVICAFCARHLDMT